MYLTEYNNMCIIYTKGKDKWKTELFIFQEQ